MNIPNGTGVIFLNVHSNDMMLTPAKVDMTATEVINAIKCGATVVIAYHMEGTICFCPCEAVSVNEGQVLFNFVLLSGKSLVLSGDTVTVSQ